MRLIVPSLSTHSRCGGVCVYVRACVRLRFRALVGSVVPCLILLDL